MGLSDFIRGQFPFSSPSIVELPEEELIWPEVYSSSISLPPIECQGISDNLLNLNSPVIVESPNLTIPEIIFLGQELLTLPYNVVDVLIPFSIPNIEGTIFVKKEQEQMFRGVTKKRTRIEVFRVQDKLNPKSPKGLDIFEMLLPLLMPPAATEFSEELFSPRNYTRFSEPGLNGCLRTIVHY